MALRSVTPRRGVPANAAARLIGLEIDAFRARLPELVRRGFPEADPTTDLFDPIAIDRWCDARYPHLFRSTNLPESADPHAIIRERMARARHG
jgi:hypothetical protein